MLMRRQTQLQRRISFGNQELLLNQLRPSLNSQTHQRRTSEIQTLRNYNDTQELSQISQSSIKKLNTQLNIKSKVTFIKDKKSTMNLIEPIPIEKPLPRVSVINPQAERLNSAVVENTIAEESSQMSQVMTTSQLYPNQTSTKIMKKDV